MYSKGTIVVKISPTMTLYCLFAPNFSKIERLKPKVVYQILSSVMHFAPKRKQETFFTQRKKSMAASKIQTDSRLLEKKVRLGDLLKRLLHIIYRTIIF